MYQNSLALVKKSCFFKKNGSFELLCLFYKNLIDMQWGCQVVSDTIFSGVWFSTL